MMLAFTDAAVRVLPCSCCLVIRSVGGGKRDRTADLLHAMQALSQLSYTPLRRTRDYSLAIPGCKSAFPKNLRSSPGQTGQLSNKTRQPIARPAGLCAGVPKGIRTPVLTVKG